MHSSPLNHHLPISAIFFPSINTFPPISIINQKHPRHQHIHIIFPFLSDPLATHYRSTATTVTNLRPGSRRLHTLPTCLWLPSTRNCDLTVTSLKHARHSITQENAYFQPTKYRCSPRDPERNSDAERNLLFSCCTTPVSNQYPVRLDKQIPPQ